MTSNVKWDSVFREVANRVEKKLRLSICIESVVVEEIERRVDRTLQNYDQPNAAKIAGVVAFWIRKLKPMTISPESKRAFSMINEYVSILIGMSICSRYFDDFTKTDAEGVVRINSRILKDLMYSFRYHSHSPHSSVILFEALFCEN
ncbi:MAG: hypothetical protein LBI62_07415 [Candidatus Accumulibacter sp.]|jgi:hypothetical protein|nr:hypothetical protein [Accumulibacter sp.]